MQAFVEYYDHHIDPEVTASAGRWILEPLGIYNGYSGVTTNQSEGFNTLLKTFTLRKESTIDSIMLALYFLQCYFSNEIQRGLAGLGQYCLLAPFKSLGIPAHEMNLQHCYAPEEIAERMMEQRKHGRLNVTALKHEGNDQGINESNQVMEKMKMTMTDRLRVKFHQLQHMQKTLYQVKWLERSWFCKTRTAHTRPT